MPRNIQTMTKTKKRTTLSWTTTTTSPWSQPKRRTMTKTTKSNRPIAKRSKGFKRSRRRSTSPNTARLLRHSPLPIRERQQQRHPHRRPINPLPLLLPQFRRHPSRHPFDNMPIRYLPPRHHRHCRRSRHRRCLSTIPHPSRPKRPSPVHLLARHPSRPFAPIPHRPKRPFPLPREPSMSRVPICTIICPFYNIPRILTVDPPWTLTTILEP